MKRLADHSASLFYYRIVYSVIAVGKTMDNRRLTTDHQRLLAVVYRPSSVVRRLPSVVCRPSSVVRRPSPCIFCDICDICGPPPPKTKKDWLICLTNLFSFMPVTQPVSVLKASSLTVYIEE